MSAQAETSVGQISERTRPLTRVNSWNEWDPLKEVVVGAADGAFFEPTEPANHPKNRRRPMEAYPSGPKPPSKIKAANQQLEGLTNLLTSKGVIVHRPEELNFGLPIKTPTFDVANAYCSVCPRDVLITFGNQVIEATMSRRSRFFEYLAYRPILRDLWAADRQMVWTAAPKPTMSSDMYNEDFWAWTDSKRYASMHEFNFCVSQEEIVFDAADAIRMGGDVFVQESMTTNRAGIEWLRRELRRQDVRVHAIHFPLDMFPSHVDCTFVPLRPGFILTNPDRPIGVGESEIFQRAGWQLVDAPEPSTPNAGMPTFCQSSHWLSMNVLSLDPNTVICEEQELPLHRLLESYGFDVLTVPFRDVYEFGGSLNCATWDIVREGQRTDYF